jgi:hypothetical protein
MNLNQGKRNKQAVSVLNKVEYDGDNPIGMTEDNTNPASCNFGTVREPQEGRCYSFSTVISNTFGSEAVEFENTTLRTFLEFEIEVYVKFNYTGTSASNLIVSYQQRNGTAGLYEVSGINILRERTSNQIRFSYWDADSNYRTLYFTGGVNPVQGTWYKFNFKFDFVLMNVEFTSRNLETNEVIIDNVTPTHVLKWSQDGEIPKNYIGTFFIQDSGLATGYFSNNAIADIFGYKVIDSNTGDVVFFAKCDEQSGSVSYNSISGASNGSILYLYEGFHGTQDIKSYQNDVGYSDAINSFSEERTGVYTTDIAQIGDTFEFSMKSDSSEQFIILGNTADHAFLIAALDDLAAFNIGGTAIMYIDGVLFTGTTRDDVYRALVDGNYHDVIIEITLEPSAVTGICDYLDWEYSGLISSVLHKNSSGGLLGEYIIPDSKFPRDESIMVVRITY